jgi:hypothetical protein
MSSGASDNITAASGKRTFGLLAQEVFSLDAAIEWVALEEAGREPRWAWRDSENGILYSGTTTNDAELVDPLLLMLAEGHDNLHGQGADTYLHRLLFVVLAYADLVQIVARFGLDAHVSVAVERRADAYTLGTRLADLLHRCVAEPLRQ